MTSTHNENTERHVESLSVVDAEDLDDWLDFDLRATILHDPENETPGSVKRHAVVIGENAIIIQYEDTDNEHEQSDTGGR